MPQCYNHILVLVTPPPIISSPRSVSTAYDVVIIKPDNKDTVHDDPEHSVIVYTWDRVQDIPAATDGARAAAFLVFPQQDAAKDALGLGKHVTEESVNIDVGIWSDENLFIFFVSSKEEAKNLFMTNIAKDQPAILAIRIVSSVLCVVYTR